MRDWDTRYQDAQRSASSSSLSLANLTNVDIAVDDYHCYCNCHGAAEVP